jgi:DNA-directed RNA polymerase alpha subunit
MRTPTDNQIVMADQAGPASSVARKLGVHKRSVVSSRKLLHAYRSWEAQLAREAELPLAERRVEFMPLARRTINILRRAGIETGAQLLSLSRQDLAEMRSVGEVVMADIDALLGRE